LSVAPAKKATSASLSGGFFGRAQAGSGGGEEAERGETPSEPARGSLVLIDGTLMLHS